MNKFYLALLGAAALTLCPVQAYEKSEYKVRPWEIINGLQPYSEQLWQTDADGISGWTASNGGVLSETSITKLWGEKVTQLTFPKGGNVTVRPGKELIIKEKVDGIDFYMYGPLNGGVGALPGVTLEIVDAKKMIHRVKLSGAGSRWAQQRWWGVCAGLLPENLNYPIQLKSIRFSKLTTKVKNDFLCFDRIGAFKLNKVELVDSSKTKNPFPLTEDGIMPIGMKKDAVNRAAKQGGSYVFSYEGKDAKIAYTYTPQSGNLSDITVTVNGKTFQPAVNGGILAKVNGVEFLPGSKDVEAKLIKQNMENQRLSTVWQLSNKNATFQFEQNFWIKGKSLAVETRALSDGGYAFDCGKTENTPDPRLIQLTYLNNRWNYPQILVTNDYFVSVFLDWFYSDASELLESPTRQSNVDGVQVYNKTSAKILGGSNYKPLTNGKRNRIYEKMYITVSPELHDVMPQINHPKSRMLDVTGQLVCSTRAYPVQGNIKHVDEEVAMWQKFHDYGVSDIFVRFHMGLQRTPVESNNISLHLGGGYQNGADEAVLRLGNGLKPLLKRIGLYNDNRVIHAFSGPMFFDYNVLMRDSDNTFVGGWDGIFRPKSGAQLAIHKKHSTILRQKFPALNGQYLDELSNAPPWADVDYDANTPGAGKFATTLRDYSLVAWHQTENFDGPIWSEGCASYFWAGVLDLNYAVSNDTKRGLPLIVDYKLMRMNPLSNYTGSDWPILHAPNVDHLIANEIACGNIGHLARSKENPMPWQGRAVIMKNYENPVKSYFMIRQVQEYFSGQIPSRIEYDIDGKLMTASEMLKGNFKPSNKIHTVYPNGLQTWVNHNPAGNWVVNADGEEFVLPPYGHVAIVPDELLQYTAIKDGHTVSYSRGKYYTYLDGRGETTEFPEMTAAYTYVIRQIDGKSRITPAPFVKAETVKGLSYTKATALNQDGTPQGEAFNLDVTDAGMGDLVVDGKAFHYTME